MTSLGTSATRAIATLVRQHFEHAVKQGYLPFFKEAAARHGVPVSLLMAIASRETEMGLSAALVDWRSRWNPSMAGLMQLNTRFHDVEPANHRQVINRAAEYLAGEIRRRFPTNLQAQIAAYNRGPYDKELNRLVKEGRNPDPATDGGNYVSDVLARSGYFGALIREAAAKPVIVTSPQTGPVGGFTSSQTIAPWPGHDKAALEDITGWIRDLFRGHDPSREYSTPDEYASRTGVSPEALIAAAALVGGAALYAMIQSRRQRR